MTLTAAEPITWWQDDPRRLDLERAAMAKTAPGLRWIDAGYATRFDMLGLASIANTTGGWIGQVPLWPFAGRPVPYGLETLVRAQRFFVMVKCRPVHPMMAPSVIPLSVQLPSGATGLNTWHSAGDGSLCLFRGTAWWDPARMIADLIPKISGWYIEYHLMMRGCLSRMPERGVDVDGRLDRIIDDCAARSA